MADAEHGLDMVLKDVRKNIEKGLATAKVEWEDAIKRGQKPLEQVRQRVLPHQPLNQPTYTARAARSNAVQQAQQNHSSGGGAPRPFVPWRGWDELESISRELRQKGQESLREMSLALSSGLEAGMAPPGGKGHRDFPRVSSDSSLHASKSVRKAPSFDDFPALEQLRAVAASAVDATPFGWQRKSNVGSESANNAGMGMGMGMRRWGSGVHHRSQSTSDLDLAGRTPARNNSGANGTAAAADEELAELDAASHARRSLAEAAVERRSLGLSPEAARPSSSRNNRKDSGRRSESDVTAFSLSAKVVEPGLPPSRASDNGQLSSAPASPEQQAAEKSEKSDEGPNNKLASFLRELRRGMKQNGEKSQALLQGLVRDLQSHLDQHMPLQAKRSNSGQQDAATVAEVQGGVRGDDSRSLHVGGGKTAPQDGAAMQASRWARAQQAEASSPGSIRDEGRSFAIVTTASLPWMTGTAVNPLLRAAYLSQVSTRNVTLVVPFLPHSDQAKLFPNGQVFEKPEELEGYIKGWVTQRVGFAPGDNFKIRFYPGRYSPRYGCVFSVGDITQYIPEKDSDVAVLEEPEHLNWFHAGGRWTDKFKHVVGVVHTNYLEYAKREEGGCAKEMFMRHVNSLMCRFHCHKVVKLSGAVQDLPKSMTEFVHGVSPHFLAIGDRMSSALNRTTDASTSNNNASHNLAFGSLSLPQPAAPVEPPSKFTKGVYFIGKVLWPKGYSELVDLVNEYKQHSAQTGHEGIQMDVYGGGEDLPAVKKKSNDLGLGMTFLGPKDHSHEDIHQYKVFVNPSLSDVVATTTAEALAMGKFVVVAKHPSNDFFSSFDNCLVYETKEQFIQCLDTAMKSEPKPLSSDERYRLTWEAATERFLDVAEISSKTQHPANEAVDALGSMVYSHLSGSEAVRSSVGNPGSLDVVSGDLSQWARDTRSIT